MVLAYSPCEKVGLTDQSQADNGHHMPSALMLLQLVIRASPANMVLSSLGTVDNLHELAERHLGIVCRNWNVPAFDFITKK